MRRKMREKKEVEGKKGRGVERRVEGTGRT